MERYSITACVQVFLDANNPEHAQDLFETSTFQTMNVIQVYEVRVPDPDELTEHEFASLLDNVSVSAAAPRASRRVAP